MEHLVEYNLTPQDRGYAPDASLSTPMMGMVRFRQNPTYGGRRVVECLTPQAQDELMRAGNLGLGIHDKPVLVIPPDLVGQMEAQRIRLVVEQALAEAGGVATKGRPPKADEAQVRAIVERLLPEMVERLVEQKVTELLGEAPPLETPPR